MGQVETSEQGGGNKFLFPSVDPNGVVFREHGVCGRLDEGKKKIVSPVTADEFRYIQMNIY